MSSVSPNSSTNAPSSRRPEDPFYGHKETAKLCTRFLRHLFGCPELSPPSTATATPGPSPPLATFIAYTLYRTRLHPSVTFAALYLLYRLKRRHPAARGTSGHRLFITAFMIASKAICDDTYSSKSWSIVAQTMFSVREIQRMEREMCSLLEWRLSIVPSALHEFEQKVRRDFMGPGPYPPFVLPDPWLVSTRSTSGTATTFSSTPPHHIHPMSPPMPVVPDTPPSTPVLRPYDTLVSEGRTTSDTPGLSVSATPTSSASPATPYDYRDDSMLIISSGHLGASIIDRRSPANAAHEPAPVPSGTSSANVRQPRSQIGPAVLEQSTIGDIYAYSEPCIW